MYTRTRPGHYGSKPHEESNETSGGYGVYEMEPRPFSRSLTNLTTIVHYVRLGINQIGGE